MAHVALRGVTRVYPGKTEVHALGPIDLELAQGEFFAVVGPSGCGKSTLLRSLNRMNDLIDGARLTGQVKVKGEDMYGASTDVIAVRRRIGMVFQKPNPFPKSIYDNVAYGPRINGEHNKRKLDEIVERSLRRARCGTR